MSTKTTDPDDAMCSQMRKDVFREIKATAYESVRTGGWDDLDDYHEYVSGLALKVLTNPANESRWGPFAGAVDMYDQAGHVADYLCPWAWKTLRDRPEGERHPQYGARVITVLRGDIEPARAALDLIPDESLTKQQRRIVSEMRQRLAQT